MGPIALERHEAINVLALLEDAAELAVRASVLVLALGLHEAVELFIPRIPETALPDLDV